MKRKHKANQGLTRGAPAAFVVSLAIHLGLLLVAGGLVVFTVMKKPEKKFVPPAPVERPKMELIKPKMKVKKEVRPGAMQRIVSKVPSAMPEIALPALTGMGGGLGSGLGGFELVPDVSGMTMLGSKESIAPGNDFAGTFYCLSLDSRGEKTSITDEDSYAKVQRRFLESGWNPLVLARFYRWPKKLYTTFFYFPQNASEFVPRSFGIPDSVWTLSWMAHYKGQFAAKKSGEYRFWGRAENFMSVSVNGKLVLMGGHIGNCKIASDWESTAEEHRKYWRGHGPMAVGDWFKLEAGVPADFEIIFGDAGGFWTQCTLTIEEKDFFMYSKNQDGAPILPIFKTAEIPRHLIDEIKYYMMKNGGDAADLEADVMFNVY